MDIYSRVISESEFEQIRVSVNEFRGKEYFHLRKYYLDFEEEWKPSNSGIGFEIDFDNIQEIFVAILEILSLSESKELVTRTFKELLNEAYNS